MADCVLHQDNPDKIIEKYNDDTSEYPIFVSMYTIDNGYEYYAMNLIESLEKFGLSYYIEGYMTNDRKWNEITKYKPFTLLKAMKIHPNRSIVWIDADATIERMPEYFKSIQKDFAVHYVRKEFASGTLFFSNSDISKNILNDWIKENEQNLKILDQQHLDNVINRKYKKDTEILPKEYCAIFDHPDYKNIDKVIVHWQASRTLKDTSKRYYAVKSDWEIINKTIIESIRETWITKIKECPDKINESLKVMIKKNTQMKIETWYRDPIFYYVSSS